MRHFGYIVLLCLSAFTAFGQSKTGTLTGVVRDAKTNDLLPNATVYLVGTYYGTIGNPDGSYLIENIKPGDYTVSVQFVGYAEKQFTGIHISANQTTCLNMKLEALDNTFAPVTVVGKKGLVKLDEADSKVTVSQTEIGDMNVRDVKEVVALQAGVTKTTDGLQIRGARVYETQFVVDNITAQDPLAGTGFGVEVSSGSIGEMELFTGGSGAEYGNGSAGVISTTIREGTEKFEVAGHWQSDHLGFLNGANQWFTDVGEFSLAGAIPKTDKKVTYFNNFTFRLTDTYFGSVANQLHSSLFANDSIWAPREDNQFTHTFKLAWKVKAGTKLTITNQHSLSINQNTRTLQIVGFDAILTPGFQFNRSLNLDNATTYTHQANLTAINLQHALNKKTVLHATVGRLFTNMRADANGRPFRTSTVDALYDEYSIVTDPVTVFNPGDNIQYVLPGPGLVNNGGISGTWHDHFVSEYTLKLRINYYPANKTNRFSFGWEQKFNHYQWVDVYKPWVGAPIAINDTLVTPSISIGSSNDIWSVKPNNGGFFVTDRISYKGIIANLGMRFNYWAPGRFADEAIQNPQAPVIDQIREDYMNHTVGLFGMRYKMRLLPKVNVSFPVTSNNSMYFNYSHSMRLPHPRFVYAGLDPEYQDRSFLSNIGNPDLNPEVNVSYEVGYKTQINKDFAVTLAAYNNNRFDYIVSRSVIVADQTGRPVTKVMYINQDYAKVQGAELTMNYRVAEYLRFFWNASYQVARGKSNSARESALQIAQTGEVPLSTEQYLAWDRPWNTTLGVALTYDTSLRRLPNWFRGVQVFMSNNYQSGYRYTPQQLEGYNDLGRPQYAPLTNQYLQNRAKAWFNTDLKINKTFVLREGSAKGITLSFEARNLLNQKNAQIINPITGKAWEPGDDVPNDWRDPRYIGPEESGTPPNNPARYLAPRQILWGIRFRF
ncbi:MAG: TonB-dependent receptor [Flavobacteriales bacterium]|nr:TonB-dependent receptor [Bacteroidota bacterium]MCB9240502.1 TonB-dependent receptor [Flavobacteriales bacterium]